MRLSLFYRSNAARSPRGFKPPKRFCNTRAIPDNFAVHEKNMRVPPVEAGKLEALPQTPPKARLWNPPLRKAARTPTWPIGTAAQENRGPAPGRAPEPASSPLRKRKACPFSKEGSKELCQRTPGRPRATCTNLQSLFASFSSEKEGLAFLPLRGGSRQPLAPTPPAAASPRARASSPSARGRAR